MTATRLEGREIAVAVRRGVAERARRFAERHGRPPSLAVVLVGEDPANVAYANSKARAAERLGVHYRLCQLPEFPETSAHTDPTGRVVDQIRQLNADATVDAILVEMPLPAGYEALRIQAAIDPARDVDGVTPDSLGRLVAGQTGPRPATPLAVMALLEAAGVALTGAHAVVVGRSAVVGKPAALLLLAGNATVTMAHSKTRDLAAVTRVADILVTAAGVPGLITGRHVKPGACVIDVGTTSVGVGAAGEGAPQGLVGDVEFASVVEVAGLLTPVPGGVGPVTTALVLQNVLDLAEARMG